MKNKRPLFGRESSGTNQVGVSNALGTPKRDTFGNSRPHFLDAVVPATPQETFDQEFAYEQPVPVLLPRHYWAPEGASTINFQKTISVPNAPGFVPLFNFTCPSGSTTVFSQYALFTTAASLTPIVWQPVVNGSRVFAYHGDPTANFQLNAPTGPDLSDISLVSCQLLLETNETISWTVKNTSGAAVQMGVRMVGYIDMGQRLTSSKFGD